MSFFVIPQRWIAPAIMAGVMAFGSTGQTTKIVYKDLGSTSRGPSVGQSILPDTIILDKRPRSAWPREKAQCVIAHEYGHLRGRPHSNNPRSIMYPFFVPRNCHRFLVRHGVR
jgi:hypothetical protein